jgi:hypothetical protein
MSVNLKCVTCSTALVDHKTYTAGGLVKESGKWCPVCKEFRIRDKLEAGKVTEVGMSGISDVNTPDVEQKNADQFRDAVNDLIVNGEFEELTVIELLGALDFVKLDQVERLRNCDHPDAQKP